MNVVILKYNAGNVASVQFALQRIGIEAVVSDDKAVLLSADKIIFPGVGEASSAMNYLHQQDLASFIPTLKQPFLGICLGMQLMCQHSAENDTKALGIFNTRVVKFDDSLKVPQIGWNTIEKLKSPLFNNIEEGAFTYFVHSYYAIDNEQSIATTTYQVPFSSALNTNNFYGVQFHPEKSGKVGQAILQNFINL